MYKNLRLILLGYSVPLLLCVIVAVVVYLSVMDAEKEEAKLNHSFVTLDKINDLEAAIIKAQSDARAYLLTKDAKIADTWQKAVKVAQESAAFLEPYIKDASQRERLKAIHGVFVQATQFQQKLLTLVNEGKTAEAMEAFRSGVSIKIAQEVDELFRAFYVKEQELQQAAKLSAERAFDVLGKVMIGGTILMIIVALAIGLFYWRGRSDSRKWQYKNLGLILLGYSVPLLLCVIVAVVVYLCVMDAEKEEAQLHQSLVTLDKTTDLEAAVMKAQSDARAYLLTKDAKIADTWQKAVKVAQDRTAFLETYIKDASQRERLKAIHGVFLRATQFQQELLTLVNEGKTAEAMEAFRSGVSIKIAQEVDELFRAFYVKEQELQQAAKLSAERAFDVLGKVMIGGTILMIIVALAIGLFYWRGRSDSRKWPGAPPPAGEIH